MASKFFTVANYEKWGNLIKQWARNEVKLPANLAEFEEQLDLAEVGYTLPDTFTELKFIAEPSNVLVVRLPPADVLKQVEDDLAAGASYAMPPFYSRIFGKNPDIPPADKLTVHAERIGDYTIQFCG